MTSPLVSVICTSYNHGDYVQDALDSVVNQTWPSIELVIIDNGSSDGSADRIRDWMIHNTGRILLHAFLHPKPLNYCQSFNLGLAKVKGKYVIDLSGDDVLLPGHVSKAVHVLEDHPDQVYFSNAFLEQPASRSLATFYPVDQDGHLRRKIASGDIYRHVVQRNFLCAPTMVVPRTILLREQGYDEALSYEDFDIIVRLARKYRFVFDENIGIKKRILKSSFSAQQYRIKKSIMLPSTVAVCKKILAMNLTEEENEALAFRIMYETKHALASANFDAAAEFLDIANDIGISGFRYRLFRLWETSRLDFSQIYQWLLGPK